MPPSIHALHVDDEPDFADVVADCLERESDRIEVSTETRVSDALNRLDDKEFDCIISDFNMPDRNGIEFLKTVRKSDPNLPFILFTGRGSEEIASDAISAGVTQYLQKETGIDQYTVLANQIINTVEKYRTEQELTETTQMLQTILDHMPTLLFTLDEKGIFTRGRGDALEDIGFQSRETVGKSVRELFADHPEMISAYERALEGNNIEELLEIGETVFQSWFQPLRTDEGDITGVVGLAVDITERRQREQELERQNDLFTKAQDIAQVSAWEYDVTSDEFIWTEQLYEMLSVSHDFEPTVRETFDFFHSDDQERVEAAYEQAIEDGAAWDIEARVITAAGVQRWVRVRGDPQSPDGEVTRIRGTIQDVTDRKEQENELRRQNERLEEFSKVVSHDLRNPLQVAKGHLEQVERTGSEESFQQTKQAHERIETIIEDVLSLARQGKSIGETATVQVDAVARDAWETVDTKDMSLSLYGNAEIDAERDRVQQLFENLFRNAAEHAGEDANVTVAPIDRMHTTTRTSQKTPSGFYVSDDGPGIPDDKKAEVFESGVTTVSDGTGFGLAIVAQIAEAHRWDYEALDSHRGGARFEFTERPVRSE